MLKFLHFLFFNIFQIQNPEITKTYVRTIRLNYYFLKSPTTEAKTAIVLNTVEKTEIL